MSTDHILGPDPSIGARPRASRTNGDRSRGPGAAAGKARSSRNALKHGLCARIHLLVPDERAAEFAALAAALLAELAPEGPRQTVRAPIASRPRRSPSGCVTTARPGSR